MSDTPQDTDRQEPPPLWQYVSINTYELPSATLSQQASRGWQMLKDWFGFQKDKPDDELVDLREKLESLSSAQLDKVAPALEPTPIVQALDDYLQPWIKEEASERHAVVIVNPPFSGQDKIVAQWAEQQGWTILEPPSPELILGDDPEWIPQGWQQDKPWVLLNLEKCYLRHAQGLDLVRLFLDRALSGELGYGLIVCDSWAWAFLGKVWNGRVPIQISLQAFDKQRLERALIKAMRQAQPKLFSFRQADNGDYIMLAPESDQEEESTESNDYLKLLAAHSRGQWEIARAVWRNNLRTQPAQATDADDATQDETQQAAPQAKQSTAEKQKERALWVNPWSQLKEPELPDEATTNDGLILHALLLHRGLSSALVRQLVSILSPSTVMETLTRLEKAEWVKQKDKIWYVTPEAYPAIRQLLALQGYLADQF